MKSISVRILICAALAAALVSCVDVPGPGYPGYGGGYGNNYGNGYRGNSYGYGNNYGNTYRGDGYYGDNRNYSNNNNRKPQPRETHCYCSHKSCGCKSGHPKSGCECDGGSHRH